MKDPLKTAPGSIGPNTESEAFRIPEKAIRKLSEILRSTDLAEVEVSDGPLSIRVRAHEAPSVSYAVPSMPAASAPVHGPAPKASENSNPELHVVRSPFVGSFYRSPSPTSASFVEVGQVVTKGQVVCIVEAMKIMNEIETDASGVVEKIFLENGTAVDFNAPLFALRKS
mgnify:CR=1 FL=1